MKPSIKSQARSQPSRQTGATLTRRGTTRSQVQQQPQASTSSAAESPSSSNEATIEKFLHLLSSSSNTSGENPRFEVTQALVKQVSKGSLGKLLTFLGDHMLGRQEVQRARALIHAVNYKSSTGDTGVIELEKARRRLRSARVAVDVARKERDEVRAKEKVLPKEKAEVEENILKESQLGIMLEVLESRETVRMKRIKEVKRMLHQLQKKVEEVKESRKLSLTSQHSKIYNKVGLRPPLWRPKHTKQTVAYLHAYHIRLNSGKLSEVQGEKIRQSEERLKGIMREKLGRELRDDELKALLTRCKDAPAAQGGEGWRHTKSGRDAEEELHRSAEEVWIKEAKIVVLNEEITAKLFLVEKYLQTVQAFQERNAATIKQNLNDVDDKARGFVGLAKDAVIRGFAITPGAPGVKEENNVLVSEQLRRQLKRCQAMEKVVDKLSGLQQRSERSAEITTLYNQKRKEVEEQSGKLLEHKVAKARVGLEIAGEVENLVEEARGLINDMRT